jgi:hypothetical protein
MIAAGMQADLAIWDVQTPAALSYGVGINPLHPPYFFGGCGAAEIARGTGPLVFRCCLIQAQLCPTPASTTLNPDGKAITDTSVIHTLYDDFCQKMSHLCAHRSTAM